MDGDGRARRAIWVAAEVMPHEPDVRKWLRKSRAPASEIDDLIQQAYCKLAELESVDQIIRPDAYFFEIVRRLFIDSMRRARVVNLSSLSEIESLNRCADEPSPEQVVAARRELDEVMQLINRLPRRCADIFRLRKIRGLSQKEIASRLRITEATVENEVAKGLRLISRAMRARSDGWQDENAQRRHDGFRSRRAD